ncbi:MAG: ParB/RepB/Spo0J family partition protein [Chloroflexota bacterium]
MARTAKPKQFQQRNLLRRDDVAMLFPEAPTDDESGRLIDLPIDEIWLDDQPRQIVPDEVLARLIEEDRARPAELLAELKRVADGHPYYRGVLQAIADLARTVAAEGVLEPLLVVKAHGRHIVRDGHRRTLASLLAGLDRVPVRLLDEPSDVDAAARQLVVNLQREDLTALEKGRWLLRLARLVERRVRDERGLSCHELVVDQLVGAEREDQESENDDGPRAGSPTERDVAAEVRRRICDLAGISQRYYYNLIYLNRLSPEAREAGLGLSEGQLRAVTGLAPADQGEIVRFIAQRGLTTREANSLVQVARSGDRDAVRRVMARLAKEDTERQRAAVSWEPLLHAVPKDLWPRCASLRAELGALPDDLRQVRLKAMWEQRRLAAELQRQFDEILELYGFAGTDDGTDRSPNGRRPRR